MKEVTQDQYKLLFALFQGYALQHTLDEIESTSNFVRQYKQEHKRYCKFLDKEVLKILNSLYDNDNKEFDIIDDAITKNAKEFGLKGFNEFFTIKY